MDNYLHPYGHIYPCHIPWYGTSQSSYLNIYVECLTNLTVFIITRMCLRLEPMTLHIWGGQSTTESHRFVVCLILGKMNESVQWIDTNLTHCRWKKQWLWGLLKCQWWLETNPWLSQFNGFSGNTVIPRFQKHWFKDWLDFTYLSIILDAPAT